MKHTVSRSSMRPAGSLLPAVLGLAAVLGVSSVALEPMPAGAADKAAAALVPAALRPKGVGSGTTWYVSAGGKDTNDGKSQNRPFRTLQKAADTVGPGDVVLIMNGEYATNKGPNPPDPNGEDPVMELRRSGTPNRWIAIRPYPKHKPVIYVRNWAGIQVRDAAYILIEGLTVRGNLREISYAYAFNERNNRFNALTAASGITVIPKKDDRQFPHHVVIRNNTVYDLPGGGIATVAADYVLIQNNVVHHTSWWSPFGNSGISFFESKNFDRSTGYKMFMLDNTVYEVDNKIPFVWAGIITDGHGLIVDVNNIASRYPERGPYLGKTLISGNNVYDIGGRGINIFRSNNIDVVDNKFVRTTKNPVYAKGAIALNEAWNILIKGNVADPKVLNLWKSWNIVSDIPGPGTTLPK